MDKLREGGPLMGLIFLMLAFIESFALWGNTILRVMK